MKQAFLTQIFFTRNKNAEFDIIFKVAIANGFKMFCFAQKVYSCEAVAMRKDKLYASMEAAVLFNLADLIVL